jgi:hypothetical protein
VVIGRFGATILEGAIDFSLLKIVQTGSGVHQASYSMGASAFSSGVKRPEHDVGNEPSPSVDVKYEWSCKYNPPISHYGGTNLSDFLKGNTR